MKALHELNAPEPEGVISLEDLVRVRDRMMVNDVYIHAVVTRTAEGGVRIQWDDTHDRWFTEQVR